LSGSRYFKPPALPEVADYINYLYSFIPHPHGKSLVGLSVVAP